MGEIWAAIVGAVVGGIIGVAGALAAVVLEHRLQRRGRLSLVLRHRHVHRESSSDPKKQRISLLVHNGTREIVTLVEGYVGFGSRRVAAALLRENGSRAPTISVAPGAAEVVKFEAVEGEDAPTEAGVVDGQGKSIGADLVPWERRISTATGPA